MSFAAAIVSGIALALSFPRYGQPIVAFVAVAPLLFALSGWNGRPGVVPGVTLWRGFKLGLVAGFFHFAGTMYWTGLTIRTYGGLSWPVAVIVVILLVLYMATYLAVAAAFTGYFIRRLGPQGLFLAPAVWVSLELLRGYLIGGLPWIPLGNTMVTLLPIAQLASLVGVYGLSFFVAWINAAIVYAAISAGRQRLVAAGGALLVLVATSVWGGLRLSANTMLSEGTPVKVGLIQGNVSLEERWNRANERAIVNRYLQLTQSAFDQGADFAIWPESSTPFYFEDHPGAAPIRSFVARSGKPLLLGSDESDPVDRKRSYNSAFMLDRGGATAAVYRKIHLVAFGEYVPFQWALFFVAPLVEAVSSFSPGNFVTMLPVNEHMVSTAICYEVTYPTLAREAVQQGSELLTTITNDAWFGRTSAAFQHFEMASMRAIEEGRFLVRAANTGFTGVVDPYGRVKVRTELFETRAVVGEARFLQRQTVYARIGDVVAYGSAAVTLLALVAARFLKR